jgi:cytosine/adenosine deaminase-related metal-dependent hydrolase
MEYLHELSRAARTIVVHGNYLGDDEITFIATNRDRMSVVYCPRTHAYFQHSPYPLAELLRAGVNVALGTDSRASNPDLDLRKEIRITVDRHRVNPELALRMGTINGAIALGLQHLCGSITVGKSANLTVIQLPSRRVADPHELLFDDASRVVATICRGRVLYSEHPALKGV